MLKVLHDLILWLLSDVRRRIHQLAESLDVLDREIEALAMARRAEAK